MKALVAVVLLGVSANATPVCSHVDPIQVDGTQGYADGLRSGKCYVSIGPTSRPNSIYRNYVFFSDGLLLIFNSYGEGAHSKGTSAREFYFFPRAGAPTLEMGKNEVSVVMSDGGRAYFDPATGQIKSFERGSVVVSPHLDAAERGGVEITRYAGLVLDAGFRMGESPSNRPDETSMFRDAQGHSCRIKNRELFAYSRNTRAVKFTDEQLSAWLSARCPTLTISRM